MTGQLAFDDYLPDWPAPDPQPRQQTAGIGYHPGPQSDLWGQRLRGGRIVTVPITQEYL